MNGRALRRLVAGAGVAAAAALVVIVVAGGPGGPSATPSGTPSGGSGTPASPLVGVVVKVDASGLSNVTGFQVRLAGGTTISFRIGVLENGDVFPPGHLAEHLATAAPVRVYFRVEGADLIVYRIEDAS
jgi:hypothetical protein